MQARTNCPLTLPTFLLSVISFPSAALDKYSFVRDAYLQRRRYLLGADTALPDYGDEDEDENEGNEPAAPSAPAAAPVPTQPAAPR